MTNLPIDLQRDLRGLGMPTQLAGILAKQLLGITPSIEAGGAADSISTGWSATVKNSNYTFAAADIGTILSHTNAVPYSWLVPADASVAIDVGTAIALNNSAGTAPLTITPGAGVILLRLSGIGGNGPQVLRAGAQALLVKADNGLWDMA